MSDSKILRHRYLMFAIVICASLIAGLAIKIVKEREMHAMPPGLSEFRLSDPLPECGQWKQHMPRSRDLETYKLYIAARRLWRSKIAWQLSREEATRILVDVRQAADKGDWGALALMAHFYRNGLGPLPGNHVLDQDADKAVEISRRAVAAGQAWGFYDLGVAHEYGYGGAIYDVDIAWAYFLKAAQLGSPDAQLAIADAYRDARRFEDEETMLHCALAQGHGEAARRLGTRAQINDRFAEAISLLQSGVKFGNKDSAASLELLFSSGQWSNADEEQVQLLRELGVNLDLERARRYNQIYDALEINPDLRLDLLDHFLPLPPAKLPEWAGVEGAISPEPVGPPKY